MAHTQILLVAATGLLHTTQALTTCPGFPGYCSESFPGQTCNVVCSFGRNNVPLCQDDGTWTDIPRCIEHEPGVQEQIPGTCPGISGYCSQGFLNQRCKFDCRTGADINSLCSSDGTWVPYPVCEGDLRETRDGCDGCPGPVGNARNRTAEAILGTNTNNIQKNRVPRIGSVDGGRKKIPTFAGQTSFGVKESQEEEEAGAFNNIILGSDGRIQQRQPQQQQQQPRRPQPQASFPFSQPNQQRPTPAARRPAPQVQQNRQQPATNTFQTSFQQPSRQQPARQQPPRQQPARQQPARQQPARQQPARQQPARQQPSRQQPATRQPSEPLTSTLFNQIRNTINTDNNSVRRQQQPSGSSPTALPVQDFFADSTGSTLSGPRVGSDQTFGPFQSVSLNNALSTSQRQKAVPSQQPRVTAARPTSNSNFFGEFQTVNLAGR